MGRKERKGFLNTASKNVSLTPICCTRSEGVEMFLKTPSA